MSPINIPLDVWLGDASNGGFKPSEYIAIKTIGIMQPDFPIDSYRKDADGQVLVCAEFINTINNNLNTDTMLWLEGIREDLSNFGFFRNEENGKFYFSLILGEEEAPDLALVKEHGSPLMFSFELTTEPFITNEKSTLLDLLMSSDLSEVLNQDLAAVFSVLPDAPKARIIKVGEDSLEQLRSYLIKVESNSIYKVAVARYFNKVIPGLIHEDMMDKIIRVGEIQKEDDQTEFFMSIDIYGQVFLINVTYDPTFDPNGEEDESEA